MALTSSGLPREEKLLKLLWCLGSGGEERTRTFWVWHSEELWPQHRGVCVCVARTVCFVGCAEEHLVQRSF